MFRTVDLMNGTALSSRVSYNFPREGGGSGSETGEAGGDDDIEFDEIPESDEDADDGQRRERREIKDDDPLDMGQFFTAGDADDDDDFDSLTPEQIAAEETEVATQLKATLDSLTLPADLIPDDFDPSDRAQFTAVLARVQTHTATNAVRAMLKPVQATLVRMATQLRQEQRQLVRDGLGSDKGQRLLLEEIPAAGSKVHGPMIQHMFRQATNKHPKDPKAAIAALKKGLKALNFDFETGESQRDDGSTIKEGKGALDDFLGGFGRLPPASPRSADRIRRRS